jgi:hypothetical protein
MVIPPVSDRGCDRGVGHQHIIHQYLDCNLPGKDDITSAIPLHELFTLNPGLLATKVDD